MPSIALKADTAPTRTSAKPERFEGLNQADDLRSRPPFFAGEVFADAGQVEDAGLALTSQGGRDPQAFCPVTRLIPDLERLLEAYDFAQRDSAKACRDGNDAAGRDARRASDLCSSHMDGLGMAASYYVPESPQGALVLIGLIAPWVRQLDEPGPKALPAGQLLDAIDRVIDALTIYVTGDQAEVLNRPWFRYSLDPFFNQHMTVRHAADRKPLAGAL